MVFYEGTSAGKWRSAYTCKLHPTVPAVDGRKTSFRLHPGRENLPRFRHTRSLFLCRHSNGTVGHRLSVSCLVRLSIKIVATGSRITASAGFTFPGPSASSRSILTTRVNPVQGRKGMILKVVYSKSPVKNQRHGRIFFHNGFPVVNNFTVYHGFVNAVTEYFSLKR